MPGVQPGRANLGTKPMLANRLPTRQKPVNDTTIDARPVATTASTQSGFTSAAKPVDNNTTPAISQTLRSIYQRSVGTM